MTPSIRVLATCGAFCAATSLAHAQIVNGSFEDGMTGWTLTDYSVPFLPPTGPGPEGVQAGSSGFGMFVTSPSNCDFSFQHGFHAGGGPDMMFLSQDANVDAATLYFDWQSAAELALVPATEDRTFYCEIQPSGGGAALPAPGSGLLHTEVAGVFNAGTGVVTTAIDVSAYVGQTVRVEFRWECPETWGGPALFEMDNVYFGTAPGFDPPCPEPPDAPDYTWTPITGAFLDISGTGTDATPLLTTASTTFPPTEDGYVVAPLGFEFCYFDEEFTELGVGVNGYASFAIEFLEWPFPNCPLLGPDTPNTAIYPFHDDLSLQDHGALYYQTIGTAPNRIFIAQWDNAGGFDDPTVDMTFQMWLWESNGFIEFHYDTLVGGTALEGSGGTAGIGIESSILVQKGVQISACTAGAVFDGDAFRIGTQAGSTVRTSAIPNPGVLDDAAPPVMGNPWTLTITGALGGAQADVVFVDLTPNLIDLPTPFGSFLCDPPWEPGVLLFVGAPGLPIDIPIPLDCSFAGFDLCAQGGSVILNPSLVVGLTNALDAEIGAME